jgi:hypothetical protein
MMIKLAMMLWDEVQYELTTGSLMQRGLNLIVGVFVLVCAGWVTVNVIKAIVTLI